MSDPTVGQSYLIDKADLQRVWDQLRQHGYRTIGPQIRDAAIVWDELVSLRDLPIGWWDDQEGGRYRLTRAPTDAWFEYVVGPHSLKSFTFPPRQTVLRGHRDQAGQWQFQEPDQAPPPTAVLGVRGCDLAALAIQDRVFLGPDYQDPSYAARRQSLFLIAVNCQRSAATCFCHSFGSGPAATAGYDLALTELADQFVVHVGTQAGGRALAAANPQECSAAVRTEAEQAVESLRQRMVAAEAKAEPAARGLDLAGLRDRLYQQLDHPRWEQVAQRCLACGNCTMVCPTCFCSSIEEVPSLDEATVERNRVWASCFSAEHSYMNSGTVRKTTQSRYRQWLTHKLAGWIDQYGVSGCVGCGRCITWCPVGIDLTQEVAALTAEVTA